MTKFSIIIRIDLILLYYEQIKDLNFAWTSKTQRAVSHSLIKASATSISRKSQKTKYDANKSPGRPKL